MHSNEVLNQVETVLHMPVLSQYWTTMQSNDSTLEKLVVCLAGTCKTTDDSISSSPDLREILVSSLFCRNFIIASLSFCQIQRILSSPAKERHAYTLLPDLVSVRLNIYSHVRVSSRENHMLASALTRRIEMPVHRSCSHPSPAIGPQSRNRECDIRSSSVLHSSRKTQSCSVRALAMLSNFMTIIVKTEEILQRTLAQRASGPLRSYDMVYISSCGLDSMWAALHLVHFRIPLWLDSRVF